MKAIVFILRGMFLLGFFGAFLFGSAADSNFKAAIIGVFLCIMTMALSAAILGTIEVAKHD